MDSEAKESIVLDQLQRYGESFPFPVFRSSDIESLETNRFQKLPSIVNAAYSTIGSGDYFLTGSFFFLGQFGEQTELLQAELEACRSAPMRDGVEYGYKYVGYEATGFELVIAITDFVFYFIADLRVTDPVVHCFLRNRGVVNCERKFTDL